jgi:hypothetical protein
MKTLVLLLLVSFSLIGHAQQNTKPSAITAMQPLVYLDSVPVNILHLYFDLNKLANLTVDEYHDSTLHINGKVFMTSKDPKGYQFLTMADLMNAYKKDAQAPTLFMVDNELLTDTSQVRIDSSYILHVKLTQSSEIAYLKNILPNLTIFKITTLKNAEKDKIMIRGLETAALN